MHAVEDLELHLGMSNTLGKRFETSAKVVSAFLVNAISNVLCTNLLSGTLRSCFVVLQVPHAPR